LSRIKDEALRIGDDIRVSVVDIRAAKVRLGVEAPKHLSIHREEVYLAIRRELPPSDRVGPTDVASQRLRVAPPPFKIRDARAADLDAINRIYNHFVLYSACTYQETPSSSKDRAEWLAAHDADHPITVAERDGEVIGWGSLSKFHPRSAYKNTIENSVYVRHDQHRQGIGFALLADLIERAKAIGHHTIMALIDFEQRGSIALHEKLGFIEVGRLREVGFKLGRWRDVVYLQRIL